MQSGQEAREGWTRPPTRARPLRARPRPLWPVLHAGIASLTWAPENSLPLGSFLTESLSFTGRPAETTATSRECKGPGPLLGQPLGHDALPGSGR